MQCSPSVWQAGICVQQLVQQGFNSKCNLTQVRTLFVGREGASLTVMHCMITINPAARYSGNLPVAHNPFQSSSQCYLVRRPGHRLCLCPSIRINGVC